MPLYEYQCKLCLHQEDKLQKMNDAPFTLCPACQQISFVRLVSAAGFQLKGSGWYVTDFKDKPKETKAEASVSAVKETPAAVTPKVTSE